MGEKMGIINRGNGGGCYYCRCGWFTSVGHILNKPFPQASTRQHTLSISLARAVFACCHSGDGGEEGERERGEGRGLRRRC